MPRVKYIRAPEPQVNHLAAVFRAYRKARGMTSKQVIMPQDYTLPEDEERIRAKVAEIDRAIEESGL